MTKITRILFAVIAFSLQGCVRGHNQYADCDTFDGEDVSAIHLEGEVCDVYTPLLPMEMCMVNGRIAYATNGETYHLCLADIHSGDSCASFLSMGRAENEALSVFGLKYSPIYRLLWANDIYSSKVVVYSCDASNGINTTPNIIISDIPKCGSNNMELLDNKLESIILTPSYSGEADSRFVTYNVVDRTSRKWGEFPKHQDFDSHDKKSRLYYGWSCINDSATRIAFAHQYTDLLMIYDIQTGEIVSAMHGPLQTLPIMTEVSRNNIYTIGPADNCIQAYLSVKCRDNKIWGLYSGQTMQHSPQTICTFDWDGRPLKWYSLDEDIVDFDVDVASKTIYAIILPDNSEDYIVKKYRYE